MSSSKRLRWDGGEWEDYIQLLLKRHHGVGNYQEVPAKHGGDFGIDGYSTNGCAYQCYAAQEPCTTKQRYEAQRNKITNDIGKFINNKPDLVKLFGSTTIHRWVLLVPTYDSALLMQHASKKSEEVLQAKLPYVSSDFKIIIDTDSCFEKEINELTNAGVLEIDMEGLESEVEGRETWLESNEGLVNVLHTKSKKISTLSSEVKLEEFKYLIVDHYLRGQNLLSNFNKKFPDIYAKLNTCKRTYEKHLHTMSLIEDNPANQCLKDTLREYTGELGKSVPNLPTEAIKTLTWEAISDWLMRCPLDF